MNDRVVSSRWGASRARHRESSRARTLPVQDRPPRSRARRAGHSQASRRWPAKLDRRSRHVSSIPCASSHRTAPRLCRGSPWSICELPSWRARSDLRRHPRRVVADDVERVGRSGRFVLRRTNAPSAFLTALVVGIVDPCAFRALPLLSVNPAACRIRHRNPPNCTSADRFVRDYPLTRPFSGRAGPPPPLALPTGGLKELTWIKRSASRAGRWG